MKTADRCHIETKATTLSNKKPVSDLNFSNGTIAL